MSTRVHKQNIRPLTTVSPLVAIPPQATPPANSRDVLGRPSLVYCANHDVCVAHKNDQRGRNKRQDTRLTPVLMECYVGGGRKYTCDVNANHDMKTLSNKPTHEYEANKKILYCADADASVTRMKSVT